MIDKFVKNTTHEVSIDYIQKIVAGLFRPAHRMPVEDPQAPGRSGTPDRHVFCQERMAKSSLEQHRRPLWRKDPYNKRSYTPPYGQQPDRNRQEFQSQRNGIFKSKIAHQRKMILV